MARPRPRAVARRSHRGNPRQGRGIRPRGRSGAAGAHAFGRRAAAGGDRARAAHRAAPADPRRADLGPHAAGGREAVRDPAAPRRARLQHPLHQPQARRDPGALPHVHRPSRRPRDRCRRSAHRDLGRAVAADDRRRAAAAPASAGRARPGCARDPRAVARAARSVRRRRWKRSTCRSTPAKWSGSPASPATASRNCSLRCPARTGARVPAASCCSAPTSRGRRPAGAASRGCTSSPRSGSDAARCRPWASRTTCSSPGASRCGPAAGSTSAA